VRARAGASRRATHGRAPVRSPGPRWWQRGVIYQIYPRSFQDSTGDGVGDLPGIIQRLDYLRWLGVDAIWISPFYPSPMADFGYDVSDHEDVDPRFGTMADYDLLLAEAHRRKIRVILDYVANHTSDQHPWFLASRASRQNPTRDWYIWRDPAPDGGPPNNWRAVFGGSAWTLDAATGQYYLHAFLPEQPDVNWRHPGAREAMLGVLRFWLDRGVDGFRIDALRHVAKDLRLRDNPPNPRYRPGDDPYRALLPRYSTDQPMVYPLVAAMRAITAAYGDDRVLIGELYLPIRRLVTYYGRRGDGLHLPFNFHLLDTPWGAQAVRRVIRAYEAALPAEAWPNWVLGNHDRSRVATRIGAAQARVAAMLLLTLRGTPTLYYGDELGMANVPIPRDRVQDPFEMNVPGKGLGRDPERTPMPWEPGPGAGFTSGDPWLPLGADADRRNVAGLRQDRRSILTLYRRLLALRRRSVALRTGACRHVEARGGVLTYIRGSDYVVALNLTLAEQRVELPRLARGGRVLLSTHLDRSDRAVPRRLPLRSAEGVVILCCRGS